MKKEKDKWIEAIAKLTKMTQESTLKWRSSEVPEFFKNLENVKVEVIYLTKYKDKILRIYEKEVRERSYDFLSGKGQRLVWKSYTVLDFVDPNGVSLWVFPEIQGLDNLFSAIRFQTAKVKDFLKDLLNE